MTEHSNGVRLLVRVPRKKTKNGVRKEDSKEAVHVQEKKENGKEGSKEAVQESKLKSWGILSAVGINLELGGV